MKMTHVFCLLFKVVVHGFLESKKVDKYVKIVKN